MEKEENSYHKINLNCEKLININIRKTVDNTGLFE